MRTGFNEEQFKIVMENYPEAYNAFRVHYYSTKGLEAAMSISASANQEELKRTLETFVKLILSDNFRDLYEFFDGRDMYVSVAIAAANPGDKPSAMGNLVVVRKEKNIYYCSEPAGRPQTAKYAEKYMEIPVNNDKAISPRLHAERYSFLKAFEVLNDELTGTSGT